MRLIGESVRSAVSQPVASTVAGLIIAGVCAAILSTTGQTVKAEQDVLARIDDAGTRSIVISDTTGSAGIMSMAVARITGISGVEWALGLGPATDVRAIANPGGAPVAIRQIYGTLPPQLVTDREDLEVGHALVGPGAEETLGLIASFGGVTGDTGYSVVGGFEADDPLLFLNNSLIAGSEGEGILRSIHILVTEPSLVGPVASAALTVLAPEDITAVSVETSQTLADVRAAVEGELGRFSRRLVTLVLAAGLVLTALSVYGAVTSRRRDFGRRRALGASREFIVSLVATQTGFAALVGAVVGTLATAVVLANTTGITPDFRFTLAIVVLAVLTAVLAALPPALMAAFSDPVRVLRVP